MISVVTAAWRKRAIKLCRQWVERQDTTEEIEHIEIWGKDVGDATAEGIEKAKGDVIVICEDDDYYPPDWCRRCATAIRDDNLQLVGQHRIIYYHVSGYYIDMPKRKKYSCSLGQMAFHRSITPLVVENTRGKILGTEGGIWGAEVDSAFIDNSDAPIVAFKGLDVKGTYLAKHNVRFYQARDKSKMDKGRKFLKSLIGDEVFQIYKDSGLLP